MIQTRKELIHDDCKRVTSDLFSRLDTLKNEKLLITGGTGFMGTWLSEIVTFLNDNYGFNIHLYLLSTRVSCF